MIQFQNHKFRQVVKLNGFNAFFACLQIAFLIFLFRFCPACFAAENFQAGPLFDQFALTLDSGQRTEAVGPFFYDQQRDTEKTWALPPFFSHYADPAVESFENDFFYPILTYERYGKEYRWQLIQLLNFSGGQEPDNSKEKRFTFFPIYFQQRSTDASKNYTAIFPLYGHINNRLFRDKIFFVLFPIYGQTQKRDRVTDNYLYPLFSVCNGDGLHGWQFWPLIGSEHKDVTTRTNGFGDVELIGGHDKYFALWPFYLNVTDGIGTGDPQKTWGALLLYIQLRSSLRDSTSVLWPFFSWIDERGKEYREWEGPWPFVIFARGEGKTTSRVWPIFSQSRNNELESDSYLWPFYQFHRIHSDPLELRRTRIMFYLFENTVEKSTETGAERRRVDMWPFFTWHCGFNGNSRLQILAPIEPIIPNNRGIERNWSPLWSIWRSENNPNMGASSQSVLWNFYRRDTTPSSKKCSLLFGIFQYQSDLETKRLRLFYIPVFQSHTRAGQ